jgi:hypothetical protein
MASQHATQISLTHRKGLLRSQGRNRFRLKEAAQFIEQIHEASEIE